MMETFSMGGYGAYVWSAIALTLVISVFNEWRARVRHKLVYRDVEVRIKAVEERR